MTLEIVFLASAGLGLTFGVLAMMSGRWSARMFPGGIDRSLRAAAFVVAFGVAGFLVSRFQQAATVMSVPAALAAGLGGAWLSAMLPLPDTRDSRADTKRSEIVGTVGRLSLPIREGGVGELVYSDEGSRRTKAACSQDGRPIEKGAEVLVTRFEKGVAIVRPVEDVLPGVRQAMNRMERRVLSPRRDRQEQSSAGYQPPQLRL